MSRFDKLVIKILSGAADANIEFADICKVLQRLGFEERIRGDHHIYTKAGIEEILNLQPKGSKAKAYQVRQVREVILNYQLSDFEDEDNNADEV